MNENYFLKRMPGIAMFFLALIFGVATAAPAQAETEDSYPNVNVGFYPAYAGGTDFYYSMFAPTEENPYAWSVCDSRCGYFDLHKGITYVATPDETVKSGYLTYTSSKYQAYWQIRWDGSLAKYKKRIKWDGEWIKVHLSTGGLDIYNQNVPAYQGDCSYEYPCNGK